MKATSEVILLVLLVASITFILTKTSGTSQVIVSQQPIQQPMQQSMQSYLFGGDGGGDDRYSRAPRPQRQWDIGPEVSIRGALDPIPTRGAPDAYQQMGVITDSEGKVLPLYGRRTAPRSDYFNYYTRTDTYNPVALPVLFKKKDCQDNAGCAEVMNGDNVTMAATGNSAKVTLYGFDGPRYVPP
jgi:hypothetical protein